MSGEKYFTKTVAHLTVATEYINFFNNSKIEFTQLNCNLYSRKERNRHEFMVCSITNFLQKRQHNY